MVASSLGSEPLLQFGEQGFEQKQSNALVRSFVERYEDSLKLFNKITLCFTSLLITETFFFVLFFSWIYRSTYMPLLLGLFFLTIFATLLSRLYIHIKKSESNIELVNHFIETCRTAVRFQSEFPEHHLAVARYCKDASLAIRTKYHFATVSQEQPRGPLSSILLNFRYLWKEEGFQIQEILLNCAIKEHINLIKLEPTHLEVHAALANCYVHLSELYRDYVIRLSNENNQWFSSLSMIKTTKARYEKSVQLAIEELDILRYYAPDDPWVHMQLACCYRDLQMIDEEIQEWETIVRLTPEDREALFTLGKCYFEQGKNALGLRVYEELKVINYKKATQLLERYGAKV